MTISLEHYLFLSALLLGCGIAVMASKRNAIGVLIGSELVLNAAVMNFAAFGRYRVGGVDGQIAGVFVIIFAAAEAAIALSIFLNLYANRASVDVDQANELRG